MSYNRLVGTGWEAGSCQCLLGRYPSVLTGEGLSALRRVLLCLGALLFLLALTGCKRGQLPEGGAKGPGEAAVMDAEQKRLLEDILKFQRETGSTLEALAEEIKRRRAAETQASGASPLRRDLAVARALLVAARRAVQSQEQEAAMSRLVRLGGLIAVMESETPAGLMRTYLERAGLALEGGGAGVEADVASADLLAALNVALESPDAPLVPEVARLLERTKAQVDKGDYKAAAKGIEELIGVVSGHASMRMLENAAAGVRGAREALVRDAWPVAIAELDSLSDLFSRFATALKAAPAGGEGAVEASNEEAANAEVRPGAPAGPPRSPITGGTGPT